MKARSIQFTEFEKLIAGEKPVLVDFWAPWCTYCRRIEDAYDRLAEKYGQAIEVVKVNIDDNEALANREQIEIIPTLVLYQNGKAAGSIVAPESGARIEAFIAETMPQEQAAQEAPLHDMVIIGGGPGGYTAALYAARAGLDVVVVEKLSAGGQMAKTHQIDNYPGFEDGVDGFELAQQMQRQAERFGAGTISAEVQRVRLDGEIKRIETSGGALRARTVVFATGAVPKALGVEHEKELTGRGVAYCAACDGMFYKGKTVAVVGGGNSAAADALLLSRVAQKVILIHRRDALRATKVYHEPLERAQNVEMRMNSVVDALLHEDRLTGLVVRDVITGETQEVAVDGVFISVGHKPASKLAAGQLRLDENGYIEADESTQTSLPGVYAVGDVRTKRLRQVVTAVADGAAAVQMAEEYLAGGA